MANLRIELGNYTVKLYHRNECLFNSPNLIIYDLDSGYYLWMGKHAKEQMNGVLNIVRTRLLEQDKLINLKSLLIYLNNLELDFSKNKFYLVHNFTCSEKERLAIQTNFPKLKWITIKQHYGLINLQESVQFYLARTFNIMLDQNQLITIIPKLCQQKWKTWNLKGISLNKGAFEDVVLTDYQQVMHGFIQLKQKIKALIKEAPTVGNSHYDFLANI